MNVFATRKVAYSYILWLFETNCALTETSLLGGETNSSITATNSSHSETNSKSNATRSITTATTFRSIYIPISCYTGRKIGDDSSGTKITKLPINIKIKNN